MRLLHLILLQASILLQFYAEVLPSPMQPDTKALRPGVVLARFHNNSNSSYPRLQVQLYLRHSRRQYRHLEV